MAHTGEVIHHTIDMVGGVVQVFVCGTVDVELRHYGIHHILLDALHHKVCRCPLSDKREHIYVKAILDVCKE